MFYRPYVLDVYTFLLDGIPIPVFPFLVSTFAQMYPKEKKDF